MTEAQALTIIDSLCTALMEVGTRWQDAERRCFKLQRENQALQLSIDILTRRVESLQGKEPESGEEPEP